MSLTINNVAGYGGNKYYIYYRGKGVGAGTWGSFNPTSAITAEFDIQDNGYEVNIEAYFDDLTSASGYQTYIWPTGTVDFTGFSTLTISYRLFIWPNQTFTNTEYYRFGVSQSVGSTSAFNNAKVISSQIKTLSDEEYVTVTLDVSQVTGQNYFFVNCHPARYTNTWYMYLECIVLTK